MEVKKGYLVTLDDGSTDFIEWSDVNPMEPESLIDKNMLQKLYRSKAKNEFKVPGFMQVLKCFLYILLLFGEIASLVFVLNQEDIFGSVLIYLIINLFLIFICWLFYTEIIDIEK